jgi:hypothetical protein
MYYRHMELRVCTHLTGRDVKIIQPELVYIIEAVPDAVVFLTSSVPQDTNNADANANDDQPRSCRARRQLGKTGTKTWTRTRPRRMYPMDPTTTTPTARSPSTSHESALCTRPASDITTGSTSHRSATCVGRIAACPRCMRHLSSCCPCLCLPCPRAASSPSPSRGPSQRPSSCQHTPHTPPRLCQGPPRRSHHWRRARCCRSCLASACRSARLISCARCVASWMRRLRGRVNADADADGDMPKPSLAMSSPLIFEDEGRDQEEEEDPPSLGPTMTKHKRKKLGLPHVCRAVAVGRGTGAGGLARSSNGKIIIPGGRFHPATRAATAAGDSSTGGQRGRG